MQNKRFKATKMIFKSLIILFFVFSIQGYFTGGFKNAIEIGGSIFISIITFYIVNKIDFSFEIKKIILPLIPTILAMILSIMQNGNPRVFYFYPIPLGLASLYADKKSFLKTAIVQKILLISLYIYEPKMLLGEISQLPEFISRLGLLIGLTIIIYFNVSWSNKDINKNLKQKKDLEKSLKLKEKIDLKINENIENLTAYSEELSANANKGEKLTTRSKKNIKSVLKKLENIFKNTKEIDLNSNDSNKKINTGEKSLKNTIETIKKIDLKVNKTIKVINNLNENSKEINDFITLIDNIAKQTNLLALNASIESARAGEAGKGFAVVAEEIRELSIETANVTKKITDLINDNKTFSKTSLKEIKSVEEITKKSKEEINNTEKIFKKIKKTIKDTKNKTKKSLIINKKIKKENEEIDNSIEEIEEVSKEINLASKSLTEMAMNLKIKTD